MRQTETVEIDTFLEYLEDRIKAKRAEYGEPGMSERSRDILETEIAELKAICRAFKQQFLSVCTLD